LHWLFFIKKCKNGIFKNGKCIYIPDLYKKGVFKCVKDNNQCIGGIKINGVCKCSNGQLSQNGKCTPKPIRCSNGKSPVNGRCQSIQPICCHNGRPPINGSCISFSPINCPPRTIKVGNS